MTVRTRRGFARLEWQKLRERNEALDCRVYARAPPGLPAPTAPPRPGWAELERRVNDPEKGTKAAAGLARDGAELAGSGGARWTYG